MRLRKVIRIISSIAATAVAAAAAIAESVGLDVLTIIFG